MTSLNDISRGEEVGKKLVKAASTIVNIVVAALLAFLFVLGCYSLWDSHNIEAKASSVQWQPYKPVQPEPLSFRTLQKQNPDVVSWLTVYGTGIDYPVCYNEQYDYYLSRTPTGEYSLTGSLFLDDRNSPDFSDFNTIVYGHHMDASVMFGPISNFEDQRYFNEHEYGNLFSQDRDWGIHFFAYVKVDAYDKTIYRTAFDTDKDRQDYLDLIRQRAIRTRNVEVGPSDRIIVLSTCSSESTNGRTILVGKITDNVYEDTFVTWPNMGTGIDESLSFLGIPWYAWLAVVLWLLLLIALIVSTMRQRRRDREEQAATEAADVAEAAEAAEAIEATGVAEAAETAEAGEMAETAKAADVAEAAEAAETTEAAAVSHENVQGEAVAGQSQMIEHDDGAQTPRESQGGKSS